MATDFKLTRSQFLLPEGVTYLDGNSLGPMPKGAVERLRVVMEEQWARDLIGAWNTADWVDLPVRVGDRIARLIGAAPGTVSVGDTLTVKIHQALAAALALRPDRRVILSDSGNFPSDLYAAQGLIRTLGQGHVLETPAPDAVEHRIDTDVAVLLLTEVDYRTARLHDMARLTARAHEAGALVVWDLAHSAGALPVDLTAAGVDFAAGCTYKYFNAGPGAPAFLYASPDVVEQVTPSPAGWFGHAAPFAFDPDYRPAAGAQRMRIGTPPVIALSILDAALDVWEAVDMDDVRRRSMRLGDLLADLVGTHCHELAIASPRLAAERGSHVSFRHPNGYAIVRALQAAGVVADFREPDILRFGITPLYLDDSDIGIAAAAIEKVMDTRAWDRSQYQVRSRVT